MLYAVTGRPGEGKSCFAVQHLILEELVNGTRPIYTNIYLHRGRINRYLKKRGLKVDLKRLHYLEEDQIRRFWIYAEKNALMVLDEVGEFFNANAWKELSSDPEWDPASYARLHRKVGHETYLIVQDLNHIYKQYRDLIAFHIQLVNTHYRKFLGFPGPRLFIAKTFDQLTPHKAIESRVYRYNKDVFELYDTSQVYEVNSGVKTNESKSYKATEKKEKGKVRRFFSNIVKNISKRFYLFLILLIGGGILFALVNAPSFILGLGEDYLAPVKQTTNKAAPNEKTTKSNIPPPESKQPQRKRENSGRSIPLIRYDSASKRSP